MSYLKVIFIKFLIIISLTFTISNEILFPNFVEFLPSNFLNISKPSSELIINNNNNNDNNELIINDNELQWTGGCIKFPCPETKLLYQQLGKYKSKNLLGTRGQIDNNIFYMALPRFRNGIPVTIVKTTITNFRCSPIFYPFPSTWNSHEEGNCKVLQSCIDLVLDKNNILWCLDKGIVSSLEEPKKLCQPKIVGINTITEKIINLIPLNNIITNKTKLQYLVVDFNDNGDTFLYISDAGNRAIIIYDVNNNYVYRINLPKAVTDGCTVKDILYLVLINHSCGETYLYFSYLGAKKIFSINTDYLKSGHIDDGIITEIGTKPFKTIIIGSDNKQTIYFRREGNSEIYKWDTTDPLDEEYFIIIDKSTGCKLATHAIPDVKLNKMYTLQSNFPDYFKNTFGCGAIQHLSYIGNC